MNAAEAKRRFGANLKRARLEKRLTQQQLADLAGLDRSTVNQVENAQWTPMIDTAEKLAKAIGRSLDDLLSE